MTATIAWVIGLSLVVWVAIYLYFHDYPSSKETAVLVAGVMVAVVGCQALLRVTSRKRNQSTMNNRKKNTGPK
jgi:ABC-type Fe3+ transport system permease subunit